jgi:hypothetical protein
MVKVGQTLHIEVQYDPLGEPGVLYFIGFHQHSQEVRLHTLTKQRALLGGVVVGVVRRGAPEGPINKMIKFDQTLHVKGQYGLIGQPGVLYFTGFHLYGGILRSTTMITLAPQYGQNGLYHSHVPFL